MSNAEGETSRTVNGTERIGSTLCARAVVVFAKLPEAGTAKSRIAATEGRAFADAVYRELLDRTARIVKPHPHYVAYTGGTAPGGLRSLFPGASGFISQEGESLGIRMRNAFLTLYAEGVERVCAVGCDCPDLCESDITETFALLAGGAQVVIGPAEDGGYYLVGCTREGLPVFSATAWSTPELLDQTMHIVEKHGLRSALLATRSDIDTMEDYRRWKTPGGS